MASRKEQKEQLRREREEREAAAQKAAQRRKLVGYGAGGALALVVVVVLVVLLAAGGGGGGATASKAVLPDGGSVPARKITDLKQAAKAASCELKSYPSAPAQHTANLSERIAYKSNPPASGRHYVEPAEDGSYDVAPDVKQLVHSQEHGRVVIWFKRSLPASQRANLKALFDKDDYQMLITPGPPSMKYELAVTAWNGDPKPNGTGRLMGCAKMNSRVYDAIQAFRDEHRSNGPEAIP